MVLMVYGKPVEVNYIGFIASFGPNDEVDIGDTTDDVYAAADGRKFVEVYITTSWREYDAEKDGPIWTEETWKAVEEQWSIHPDWVYPADDLLYEEWCLGNNWSKLDNEAGIYVCGEGLWDDDWQQWIESEIQNHPDTYKEV